jgi:hypothetical protein
MDREPQDRGVDTNMQEVKKLLHCLVTNGYIFNEIQEDYSYPDDAIAYFSKDLAYTDTDGNYINDSKIKISIQFEKRADYTTLIKHPNGDFEYGDPIQFIEKLIEEIKHTEDFGRTKGGKKRCSMGKKRKTQKNKPLKSH